MSDEGERTCPLCAEEMDMTDQQLKPCKCGYEICVWCWHHIMDMAEKDDSEGRCPACRSAYDKEKIVGMTANCGRMAGEGSLERKKSQKTKTKISDGRKQLSSVRVIQRNLVYIVGLPLTLADEDLLQNRDFFGQYGRVLKVSMSRTAAGVIQQFPNSTCSVYITYAKEEEAIRCIQSVHGFVLDGKSLKACFGTTKYCHAWLRNVACTNPDCLYLHEVGSQEDSFTKDEIISAYTRNRVQQITGATTSTLRRAGNVLPPPMDDYNITASTPKPIVRSASNATVTGRNSPPNGSSGRSAGLPPAASWGTRSSSLPQVGESSCSIGIAKLKLDPILATTAPSSIMENATLATTLQTDKVKSLVWDDDGLIVNSKGKSDTVKPMKQRVKIDSESTVLERTSPDSADVLSTGILSFQSCSPLSSIISMTSPINSSSLNTCGTVGPSMNEGFLSSEPDQNSYPDSLRVDSSAGIEIADMNSSFAEHVSYKSVRKQGFVSAYGDQDDINLSDPARESETCSLSCAGSAGERLSWSGELHVKADTGAEVEEDVIFFDNQRLKDPEVISRPSYVTSSLGSLAASNHSRSSSLQHNNDTFNTINANKDYKYSDGGVGDSLHRHPSGNLELLNGYSYSENHLKNVERSQLFSNDIGVKPISSKSSAVSRSNSSLDMGESSIISDILSLDLDSWDDSLNSPHSLVKLLAESDKQAINLKCSNPRKTQGSSQSRFSFARQEVPSNQSRNIDSSYNACQLPRNRMFAQDYANNSDSHTLNSLSSNFGEPRAFTSGLPPFSSTKPSVSRGQISAPPGFSIPNRPPPPGFPSHERGDQNLDFFAGGNHVFDSLPRNSYQASSACNVGNAGDIEFMDPAILAVGKGRLQDGLTNPVVDVKSIFPQQFTGYENDARLQLLMQRTLSPQQNSRFTDDGFLSFSDSYGISSRHVDQSQVHNLSPFAQLSLQQSREPLVSNGHWDGWNEMQGGNNMVMAELLRNERLGLNKLYGTSSYDDGKFRLPTSGDLYNRSFDM